MCLKINVYDAIIKLVLVLSSLAGEGFAVPTSAPFVCTLGNSRPCAPFLGRSNFHFFIETLCIHYGIVKKWMLSFKKMHFSFSKTEAKSLNKKGLAVRVSEKKGKCGENRTNICQALR